VLDALELELHVLAQLDVERAQRLVQEQRRRPVDQRPGERHPLLLPAGELRRTPPLVALQRDHAQHLPHPRAPLALGHALEPRPERDVVLHGHVREQRVVLEHEVHVAPVGGHVADVLTAQQHASARGRLEPRDQAQRGGLPAPGGPEQGEELALADRHVDLVHGGHAAVALDELLQRDGRTFVHVRAASDAAS
jgi:hypothetical protein